MTEKTNADRAQRFENGMRAYIGTESVATNSPKTWLKDMLCDMRHWCQCMRIDFDPYWGEAVFKEEDAEDAAGDFKRADDWVEYE